MSPRAMRPPAGHRGMVDEQDDSSGGGITEITSDDGSITIENPTGPTANLTATKGPGAIAATFSGEVIPSEGPTSTFAANIGYEFGAQATNHSDPILFPSGARVIVALRGCAPQGNAPAMSFTLYKNSVPTGMTCTIPAGSPAGTTAADVAHPIAFTENDTFDVLVTIDGAADPVPFSATLESSTAPLPPGPPIPVPTDRLVALFDAAAGVTRSGANVIGQADQSGNGHDMVAMTVPPTFNPSSINGQPGIVYDGTADQGLHNTTSFLTTDNSPRSYFCVCKPSVIFAQTLFDWRAGANDFYQALGSGGTFYYYGNGTSNAFITGGSVAPGVPILVEFYSDGVNVSLYINGVLQAPAVNTGTAGGDNGPAGFVSGNYFGGTSAFIGEKSYEGMYSKVLTNNERLQLREVALLRFDIDSHVAPLTIRASSSRVAPGGLQQFNAAGGAPPYSFSITTNHSGGSIDGSTGLYHAGPTGGTVDVIAVADSGGGSITTNVAVASAPALTHITNGKRTLFLGDSTTYGGGGGAWRQGTPGFVAQVNAALSPGAMIEIDGGHPGASSADILTNFPAWVTANTPDLVYLSVGINDVMAGVDPITFETQIGHILSQILAGTATAIAVTAITCHDEIWSTGSPPTWGPNSPDFDEAIDVFNTILESAVNALGNPNVAFDNFREQLLSWETINNPQPAGARGFATNPGDGIHPNAAGRTAESGFAFAQVQAP